MELRQLVSFDAIVRAGGFTHAAAQLRIAQPAVSAQLRRLESELGVQLLRRTTRRVALTEAGELFLVRVRRVLRELEQARGDLADLAEVVRGRAVLGSTQMLGAFDLPAALAAFTARYPGVEVALRSSLVEPMLDDLVAGGVDLVLAPIPDTLPGDLRAERLGSDRLVLITPPGHALAGRPRLTWRDVAGETFVSLPTGTGLRDLLVAAAGEAGVEPRVRFEAETPRSVLELVAAGLGVALTVESEAARPGTAVDVHELEGVPPHPPYGVIRDASRAQTPVARALAEHLVRFAHLDGAGRSR